MVPMILLIFVTMKSLVLILFSFFMLQEQKPAQVELFKKFEAFDSAYIQNPSKDTIVVMNFWATWCKPCVKELPYFLALDSMKEGKPIKVILVSLDFEGAIESRVKPFMEQLNIQSKVVVLGDGNANSWINKVDSNWSGAIPATLFLKDGKRAFIQRSYHSVNHILRDVKKL